MKHLGDITKIDGTQIEPVWCISGGSPCQDLSVAGKRAGLAGERSGLFMEQIRVVKEMRSVERYLRGEDKPIRLPRYVIWENVDGARSSNFKDGFGDFGAVLEEFVRVAEPTFSLPRLEGKQKWTKAGTIIGDGYSLAWRIHDAQFFGVPQRRRRICLCVDYDGYTAPDIVFECIGEADTPDRERAVADTRTERRPEISSVGESVSGDTQPCEQTREEAAGDIRSSIAEHDRVVEPIILESNQNHATVQTEGICTTLPASMGMGGGYVPMVTDCIGIDRAAFNQGQNAQYKPQFDEELSGAVAYTLQIRSGCDGGGKGPLIQEDKSATLSTVQSQTLFQPIVSTYANSSGNDIAGTLDASYYKGCGVRQGHEREHIAYSFKPQAGASAKGIGWQEECSPTLSSVPCGFPSPAVLYDMTHANDAVRECGDKAPTLQSRMGTGGNQIPLTVERVIRWIVRRLTPMECERLQGFPDKWTDIGEWTDSKGKKHKPADTPRYKALGNSIAVGYANGQQGYWCWMFRNMAKYLPERATLGSLFDGIGGFPLAWEAIHGKGSARWASEIEEFPIAVTKIRFPEEVMNEKGE